MLLLRDTFVGMPIMSLQTGAQVGEVESLILDPRRLNIVAFYCAGPLIGFNPAILHTDDIREFSSIGLIVDDSDNIMPPDDLVRLKEILDFHFQLEGMQVVEDGGRKLGKVGNFTVDSESFYVIKLHVKPSLLQSFGQAELLIDRAQITAINDKQIVVKRADASAARTAKVSSFMPAIDNPFRKAGVPEAHGTSRDQPS